MKRFFLLALSFLCMSFLASIPSKAETNDKNIPDSAKAMPFTYYKQSIILNCLVDGKYPGHFLFDTGAGTDLYLDTTYINEVKFPIKHRYRGFSITGLSGKEKVRLGLVEVCLTNHGNLINYPSFYMLDIRAITGRFASGIMSLYQFKKTPFEINFENQFIRRMNEVPDSVKRMATCLPITYKRRQILVNATVYVEDRKISGLYVLDTGNGNSVYLLKAAARQFDLEGCQRKKPKALTGKIGVGNKNIQTVSTILADSIDFGGYKLQPTPIFYQPDGEGNLGKVPFVGFIGIGVLKHFNMVIDIPNERLYVWKNKMESDKSDNRIIGFNFVNRSDVCDGGIVGSLMEGSDAQNAGICIGDTILSVNDKAMKDMTAEEESECMKSSEVNVTWRGKDGKVKQADIKARDYWN